MVKAHSLHIGEPKKSFEGLRDYRPLPLFSHYQKPEKYDEWSL